MALRAHLFHLGLPDGIVRPLVADGVGQIKREPVGRIVGQANAIEAAHVTSGAGGHKHIAGGESLRRGVQIEQVLLSLEHHPVFGFLVNFDLRVIRPHVALSASRRQARNTNRTGMPGVALRAGSDGPVSIGAAYAMALLASTGHRRSAFELYEWMRRPARASRLVLLREVHLLGS